MKIRFAMMSLAILAAVISFSSCDQKAKNDEANENQDSVQQEVDTLADARREWEQFRNDARERIRQNEDSIKAFRERTKDKAKGKYDKAIAELEEENNELKAKLEDYKEEGKDKWENFKADWNRAMDTVGQKWKDLTTKENKK